MISRTEIIADVISRSRKGAWIEINAMFFEKFIKKSRSRKGAWIEILIKSI